MRTPILETERLFLRPLCIDDAETIYKNWTSDPDVAKFMRWELHKDVSETFEWLLAEQKCVATDEVYNWGFVLKETGELIGSGGLVFIEEKGMYELGYNVMKKYWGLGIATEASTKIIDYGVNELQQKKFYCCHAKDNPASGKVMMKVGFVYQNEGKYYSWNNERQFECKEYMLVVE